MLQMMGSLSTTLSSVSTLVESTASKLRQEVTTDAHRFVLENIPNEVLANVFEAAYDLCGRERNDFSRSIVRVCRKYREIARKLPRLWSYFVFDKRVSRDMDLFFELSRDYSIVVEVHCRDFKSLEELKAIMQRLEPHLAHVKELTLYASRCEPNPSYVENFLEFLRDQYAGVEFRALDTLRLFYWVPSWSMDPSVPTVGQLRVEEGTKMFFKTWKTPVLRELEIANHIPVRFDHLSAPISCLKLVLGTPLGVVAHNGWLPGYYPDESSYWNFGAIVALLTRCGAIEELSITFSGVTLTDDGVAKLVSLPKVSKLSLASDLCEGNAWKTFIFALQVENVKQLDLDLCINGEGDMTLRKLAEPFRRYEGPHWDNWSKVKEVVLAVEILNPDHDSRSDTETFLTAFPNLRKLTLKGRYLPLPAQLNVDELETIRVENSRRLDRSFLQSIDGRNYWEPTYGFNPIRNIELVNCVCECVDDTAILPLLHKESSLVWCNQSNVRYFWSRKTSFSTNNSYFSSLKS